MQLGLWIIMQIITYPAFTVRAPPLTVRPLLAVRRSATIALPVTVKSPVIEAPFRAFNGAPLIVAPLSVQGIACIYCQSAAVDSQAFIGGEDIF